MSSTKNIQSLFNPKSIAVIGASRNPEKVGGAVLENLIKSGYKGKLLVVNPEAEEVQGVESRKSIKSLKSKVELAIIIVPAQVVADVLKECGEMKIKSAIIISSGFREIGKEGKELEDGVVEVAQKYGILILGPNCLGILNAENNLNASFASSFPKKGNVALVSQSGAIISSLIDWGDKNNLGFSKIVSLGNKADLDETDMLEYLAQDKETKVIAMYLETISRGKKFIEIARKTSLLKPIIALKTGVSQIGQAASQSHTGALATEDRIVDAALRKSGIIRVFNTQDLLRVSQLLAFKNKISRDIFVISNAGGLAVSAADIASSQNLGFAEIKKSDEIKISKIIPKFLSVKNPLDIGGDAKSDRYKNVLEIIASRRDARRTTPYPSFQRRGDASILAIITPQKMTDFKNIAGEIAALNKKGNLILPILAGGDKTKEAWEILIKEGIPVYDFPEEALHVLDIIDDNYIRLARSAHFFVKRSGACSAYKKVRLASLLALSSNCAQTRESYSKSLCNLGIAKESFYHIKKIIQKYSGEWISLDDALKIAENLDIPIVKSIYASSSKDLDPILKHIKFPLVAKTSIAEIIHKAKSGQVACDINSKNDLEAAFLKIKKPVIIQHQEKKDLELIIGAKRPASSPASSNRGENRGEPASANRGKDENFGAMLMFGLGGVMANELNQAKFYMMPLNLSEAENIVNDCPMKNLFSKSAKSELVKIILSLQKLMLNFSQISEVDLNPVMINFAEEKIICPDVKIRVK